MPLASASKTGSASSKFAGSFLAWTRSSSFAASGLVDFHASNFFVHSAWAACPRSIASRVCAMTASSTSNVCSGSKPSSSFVALISASPSAEPWALPVFCFVGAG